MHLLKKVSRVLDSTDKSGIKSMFLKPISMVLSIVYTPLLLSYLGTEQYGLWATILSVITWVNYCDVGIGHGLRNLLTKELTEKQYEKAKKSVSTAYIILSLISLGLFVIVFICALTLDWKTLFHTNIEVRLPFVISFVFIIINFVLALSNTLLYSMQMAERVALRSCLVQVLNIIGIVLLNAFTKSNLVWMSILFGMSTTTIYVFNSIQLFLKYDFLRPSINLFDRRKIKSIASVGVKFFVIQLSILMIFSVDNFIITHYFGPSEVTPFNIVNKAYNIVYSFLSALLVPYWSKTTQMLQKGDIDWVKKANKKMMGVLAVFVFGYIVLALIFEPLACLWLGYKLEYQHGLVLVMCIYYIFYSIVTTQTPFINGSGKINGQLIVSSVMGILSVPLAICLGVKCGLGPIGVRLATTIIMAFEAVFYPLNLRYILKKIAAEKKNENNQ